MVTARGGQQDHGSTQDRWGVRLRWLQLKQLRQLCRVGGVHVNQAGTPKEVPVHNSPAGALTREQEFAVGREAQGCQGGAVVVPVYQAGGAAPGGQLPSPPAGTQHGVERVSEGCQSFNQPPNPGCCCRRLAPAPLHTSTCSSSSQANLQAPQWHILPPRNPHVKPSKEQEAMMSAPGSPPKATPDTGSAWPGILRTGEPRRTSHTITVSSKLPLAWGRAGAARRLRGRAEVHLPSCATLRASKLQQIRPLTQQGQPTCLLPLTSRLPPELQAQHTAWCE